MRNKYEITREAYDAVAFGYAENTFKKRWMAGYINDFSKNLPKSGLILDLGCGPGCDSSMLIDLGFEVTGVDFSQEMISEAKKRVPKANFVCEDMRDIDFPDNTFDAVWCVGSLHHLTKKDVPDLFRKLYLMLKQNSSGFISTQYGEGERYRIHKQVSVGTLTKKFWSFWKPEHLTEVLKDCGFEILDTKVSEPGRKSELKGKMKQEKWVTIWFKK